VERRYYGGTREVLARRAGERGYTTWLGTKAAKADGVWKDRSGGHGGLLPTSRADPAVRHGRPSLAPAAARTPKTLGPAQRHEVSTSGGVRGEAALELQDRLGILLYLPCTTGRGRLSQLASPDWKLQIADDPPVPTAAVTSKAPFDLPEFQIPLSEARLIRRRRRRFRCPTLGSPAQ